MENRNSVREEIVNIKKSPEKSKLEKVPTVIKIKGK